MNEGPHKRSNTEWMHYKWFRQAWCETESVEFDQSYGVEEAKLRCEIGVVNPVKKEESIR